MWNHEGSASSSAFSYTIHGKVKAADAKLAMYGGCARFSMDDGYMVGPREVIFTVVAEFAAGVKEDCGCELNVKKCLMCNPREGVCKDARARWLIPHLRVVELRSCIILGRECTLQKEGRCYVE